VSDISEDLLGDYGVDELGRPTRGGDDPDESKWGVCVVCGAYGGPGGYNGVCGQCEQGNTP